jgi:hypothetical protein
MGLQACATLAFYNSLSTFKFAIVLRGTLSQDDIVDADLDGPVDQVTSQIQFARKRDLPVRTGKADALETLTPVVAFLAPLLLTFEHLGAVFDRVLFEPLDGFLDIHRFIPAQFQGIIDVPVSLVDRHPVVRQAVTVDAGNVPGAEQRKVPTESLIVGISMIKTACFLGVVAVSLRTSSKRCSLTAVAD